MSRKNWIGEYYLINYTKLDYVIPVAFQGSIVLIADLDGKLINNIYNPDEKYRIASLHLCLFPFENTSIVMMFVDSNDKRYRDFAKQFRKKNLEEQLAIMNYILFLYTEDYFVSKQVSKEILENEDLHHLMPNYRCINCESIFKPIRKSV